MDEKITWSQLLKKMKVGDTIMVKNNDGTVHELKFEGFMKKKDGSFLVKLKPLSLEVKQSSTKVKP